MKKRIFIAADISEEARIRVSDYIDRLKSEFKSVKAGWEKPEKLHITLKFLGDLENAQIEEVIKTAGKAAGEISRFSMKIEECGVFPDAKRARILWLGLRDETESLKRLNKSLENALEKRGFSKEKKSFKPHLTVARLREPRSSGELVTRHLESFFEPVAFEIGEIVIYESRLEPAGSVYFPVERISI